MPYKTISSLPKSVKGSLPKSAQSMYLKVFNSAWKQYKERGSQREVLAHKVAWSAVKKEYKKNKSGKWVKK